MLDLLIMLAIDVLGAGAFDGLWEMLRSAAGADERRHRRVVACLAILGVGVLLGAATAMALPARLLHPGPFPGVSLVVLPPLLALWLHTIGLLLRARGRTPSQLATWYGGACFGLGLTAGRLIALANSGAA